MDLWTTTLKICERMVMRPENFHEYYEYILRRSRLLVEDEDGLYFRQMMAVFRTMLADLIDENHRSEVFISIPFVTDLLVAYPMFKQLWETRHLAEKVITDLMNDQLYELDGEIQLWVVATFMDRIYASIRAAVAALEAERKRRTHTYKEELIATVYHPDRACRFAERFGMEPMHWLILQAEGTGWEE